MINLSLAAHTLELLTTASVSTDWYVSYDNRGANAPGAAAGNVATGTTTTLLAGPASGVREVNKISIRNKGTASQTVTLKLDVSSTDYYLTPDVVLQAGETLEYEAGAGFSVKDISGRTKQLADQAVGTSGYTLGFYKVGITAEAAGEFYTWALNTGFPGAWAVGTSGVNGRNTDGNAAPDAGCLPYINAASGANYLTGFSGSSTVACRMELFDVVWVNDALDVTLTDPQAITTAAFPARDINGSANGAGYSVGILVTGATGNAGAVTNITLGYTNQSGTASKTATMASFPATATAGTVVWFQLAAGDYGVRSIQSITIGTTLASGTISLIVARRLAAFSASVPNVGGQATLGSGVRLYDDTCPLLFARLSATTAMTCEGEVTISNR